MPAAYVEKLAKGGKHGSKAELEHKWSVAKKAAADQGRADDYAYIMGIFQRAAGVAASTQPLKLEAAFRLKATE